MAAQQGRELLLKIHDESEALPGGNYEIIGGFKTNNFGINGQAIDISNKDSNGFKETLEGGGQISLTFDGNGVFLDDAAFKRTHDHMLAQTHPNCIIIIPDFAQYTGKFAITGFTMAGNDGDAISYNISFESTGPIAVTTI